MEDKELVKMFNPTWKKRETILIFLIVVINGLTCRGRTTLGPRWGNDPP